MSYLVTHINSYLIASPLHAELVAKFDKLGLQQRVYVPVNSLALVGKNRPENLKNTKVLYDHCYSPIDRYLWPLKMLKIWRSFKKHYIHQKPSIIHAHTLIVNGLIAFWAFKKWGIPYVVSIRYTDIQVFMNRSRIFKAIGLIVLKKASAIIFLSPAYKNTQIKVLFTNNIYKQLEKKFFVIPNGINEFWINNRQAKKNLCQTPTVIFVGSVDKRKNLVSLINACELLKKQGFNIYIDVVGDGPMLNSIKSKKYKTSIRFYGKVFDKNLLLERYRNADVLVVPSLIETFGLVYPEAMSQGLPVIYTKNEGFDGFYPDGQVGFSVNPKDPDDIAQKIKMVFDDYHRISKNAFEASIDFSWDNVTNKLMNVYSEVGLKN